MCATWRPTDVTKRKCKQKHMMKKTKAARENTRGAVAAVLMRDVPEGALQVVCVCVSVSVSVFVSVSVSVSVPGLGFRV